MPSFKIYLIFDAVKLLYADLPSYKNEKKNAPEAA